MQIKASWHWCHSYYLSLSLSLSISLYLSLPHTFPPSLPLIPLSCSCRRWLSQAAKGRLRKENVGSLTQKSDVEPADLLPSPQIARNAFGSIKLLRLLRRPCLAAAGACRAPPPQWTAGGRQNNTVSNTAWVCKSSGLSLSVARCLLLSDLHLKGAGPIPRRAKPGLLCRQLPASREG